MVQSSVIEETKRKCFIPIMEHDEPFRVKWDLLVMILSIVNGVTVPLDISFKPQFFGDPWFLGINYVIDVLFVVDVVLNFRTTYKETNTGEEVFDPRKIACNYMTSFQFYLDVISALSLDNFIAIFEHESDSLSANFKVFQLFKFFRLLRLSKFIDTLNSSQDIKLSMKLFKMCVFLLLYIHCAGCVIYLVATRDRTWRPA